MTDSKSESFISTKRIETLVDGIFAIAMTLLVLNIDLPNPGGIWTNIMVWDVIWGQINNLFVYALSFFLLAGFWVMHHRYFDKIRGSSQSLLWLNVIWLLFIALVPFSTSLYGDFGQTVPAALFFHINLFLIGVFSFLIQREVIEDKLVDKVPKKDVTKHIYTMNTVFPSVALLGILMAFIIPQWSSMVYLLVIPIIKILHKI